MSVLALPDLPAGALPVVLGAADALPHASAPSTAPKMRGRTTSRIPRTRGAVLVANQPECFGRIHSSFERCSTPAGVGHGSSATTACIVKAARVIHGCDRSSSIRL